MRTMFKKAVALALAAAMMIPVSGISAKAETKTEEVTVNVSAISSYVANSRAKSADNTTNANNIYVLKEKTGDNSANLVDGDADTTMKYGGNRVVIIDMGDVDVSKVEVYNVAGNYCFATSDQEAPTAPGKYAEEDYVTYTAASAIRLNKSEGYNISNKDNLTYGDDGVVTIQGIDFGRYLIIDANGSQAAIGEVKVYTDVKVDYYTLTIGGETYQAEYNDKVTVTASEQKGEQVFAYWTKNGEIISYDREYTFYVSASDTIEAVYADEAPEAKACYYISYAKEDDNVVFYAECNFPADVTDGRVIIGPNVVGADGNKINMTNSDNKNLSGGNQFKVTLGGASSFDEANFAQSRIKFEGLYTNTEGSTAKAWAGGTNFWFYVGTNKMSSYDVELGSPAGVTSGYKATTF